MPTGALNPGKYILIRSTNFLASFNLSLAVFPTAMKEIKKGLLIFCHNPFLNKISAPGPLKPTAFKITPFKGYTFIQSGSNFLGCRFSFSAIFPFLKLRVVVLAIKVQSLSFLKPGKINLYHLWYQHPSPKKLRDPEAAQTLGNSISFNFMIIYFSYTLF